VPSSPNSKIYLESTEIFQSYYRQRQSGLEGKDFGVCAFIDQIITLIRTQGSDQRGRGTLFSQEDKINLDIFFFQPGIQAIDIGTTL
jgi:hypothetical protein